MIEVENAKKHAKISLIECGGDCHARLLFSSPSPPSQKYNLILLAHPVLNFLLLLFLIVSVLV